MKDWIKKNRDALLITGVGILTTAATVALTYKVTNDLRNSQTNLGNFQMSMIAQEAGVLDKIIAHQEKLASIVK
jgi:hypothetical protein